MVIPATQMAAKIAAPASTATTIMATRSAVQPMSSATTAYTSTTIDCRSLPNWRRRKSETITWSSELRGLHEHEVEVPVADQLRQQIEVADGQLGDRERDAGDAVEEGDLLHGPAAELRTLSKMTRMAMKSRNETRKTPTTSSANDVRYCHWRARAPTTSRA